MTAGLRITGEVPEWDPRHDVHERWKNDMVQHIKELRQRAELLQKRLDESIAREAKLVAEQMDRENGMSRKREGIRRLLRQRMGAA
jgi:hypothetical protein